MKTLITKSVMAATAAAFLLAPSSNAFAGDKEERLWGYGLGALALGAIASNYYNNSYDYGYYPSYYTGSYSYPSYSYGYDYGYSYPSYSYGYSYPSYSYGYSYPSYSYGYYYY